MIGGGGRADTFVRNRRKDDSEVSVFQMREQR